MKPMDNKQTAVEWLIEQWPILESQLPPWLINQAKAMEREQIVNAVDGFPLDKRHLNGEQYYNETYKQTDNE